MARRAEERTGIVLANPVLDHLVIFLSTNPKLLGTAPVTETTSPFLPPSRRQ
jgi:hypothetical protein